MVISMPTDLTVKAVVFHRTAVPALFLVAVALPCVFLYRAADSMGFRSPRVAHVFPFFDDVSPPSTVRSVACMPDKSVILTTLNEAWATPNSVVDFFLESFRIGEKTRRLLDHLVIISLDRKAFSLCLVVHTHCFALVTEGVDFSHEAYFMTPDYLKIIWRRIDFLRSVLEMGYNFVFMDADVMWFRDLFPDFHPDADIQIACDHFSGNAEDIENKPNGGFKFVRSNNRSIKFYKFWYSSRKTYPGLHDQDVLNKIKNDSFITESRLKMRFLDTALFANPTKISIEFVQCMQTVVLG